MKRFKLEPLISTIHATIQPVESESMTENSIRIRTLNREDIPEGMFLVRTEGWNQTEKDWHLLVDHPQNVCLAAETDGKLVGTATAINYNNDLAWIGMVLVNREYRGRGISKVLLSRMFDELKMCKSIKLDATPAGKAVYEKIGFQDEYLIHRMVRVPGDAELRAPEEKILAVPLEQGRVNEIVWLDAEIFGVRRDLLLHALMNNDPDLSRIILRQERISGYALGRTGSRYTQIGPVSARSEEEAKALVYSLLKLNNHRPLVVDALDSNPWYIDWLHANGFLVQRSFTRMYLGENPFPGKLQSQFLICGPEFG